MSSAVGIQPRTYYYGCVEDRMDPLELGRVRVRVLGVHSENINEVPTEDLPWAPVILASNNAGTSGVGWSPNGLLPGSWVELYFADGVFCQKPVVTGTLVGINPTSKNNSSDTVVKDAKTAIAEVPKSEKELGWISELYESGNKDSLSKISSGSGDTGGKSYGPVQLSLKSGTLAKFVQMSKFRTDFAGLELASLEFDNKWKDLALNKKAEFKEDNRLFIEATHFTPCALKLPFLKLSERHIALSEMVWSYGVQYGSSGGSTKIKRALNGKNVDSLSDADIIELCYNDRKKYVEQDFKNSPSVWGGLKSRFENEKKSCLDYCGSQPSKDLKPADELPKDSGGSPLFSHIKIDSSPAPFISKNLKTGFVDPSGKYPKSGYLGKTDTNRLAKVKEIDKTIQRNKRLGLVKGNGFNEPHVFDPRYPYNQVFESESGHIFEFDNTPEKERVHVYHRSGSFIEFHPDGTIVKKSMNDDNEVVISNKSIYVFGNHSMFVEGNIDVKTLGNTTIESEGNTIIRTAGNMQIAASGNIDILAGGVINTASGGNTIMNAPFIEQNNGSKSENVVVDVGASIELQKIPPIVDDGPIVDDYDQANNSTNQVFATKQELDENAGFVTESGPAQTTSKPISSVKEPAGAIDSSTIESASSFPASLKLSKNFNLGDLTTSCVFKYSLQEQMGLTEKEIVLNLQALAANVLEPIVSRFTRQSFIITCALRRPKGKSKSQHLLGMAVDIQFPGNAERVPHIAQEISQMLSDFDQLILEYHSRNPVIHISFKRAGGNRKMKFTTFTSDFKGKTPLGFYDRNQNLIYPA